MGRELEEVHNNVKSEADINKHLKATQILRELLENEYKRGGEQSINCETICEEVPNLWQSIFLSNDVPLPDMLLGVVDVLQIHVAVIIIVIFVESAIQSHCTEFNLDEVIHQSGPSPQLFGSILFLLRGSLIPWNIQLIIDFQATAEELTDYVLGQASSDLIGESLLLYFCVFVLSLHSVVIFVTHYQLDTHFWGVWVLLG